MSLPHLEIVTPYSAAANNGNWRTAARWMRLLRGRYRVILQPDWQPGRHAVGADCLIALHARRSHPAIQEWCERFPHRPLIVVLTGTDLYRDLPNNKEARDSVQYADRLIVLQEDALRFIQKAQRAKARVVYQSAHALVPAVKARNRLNCILVGHMRPEKDPRTAIKAWSRLPAEEPVFLLHVGGALDRELGNFARAFARQDTRYRWVGAMPHSWTRQAIKRAHLLILPSKMEGGANVVVEALSAGTPVLGSHVSGNIGMLGADYAGYFPVGDFAALAAMLLECRNDPPLYDRLARQCQNRSTLFRPGRERSALLGVIRELV